MPAAALKRIKDAASGFEGGRQALAVASEIPFATLTKLLLGEAEPRFAIIIKLCRALNISLDWVATGVSRDNEASDWESQLEQAATGEKRIPAYNVYASAGFGLGDTEEQPEGYLTFPLNWLVELGDVDQMQIIKIDGDSMEPELRNGDHVMIDKSQVRLADGLYAVSVDYHLFVKRVRFKGKLKADLVSANPLYPPFEITVADPTDCYQLNQDVARIIGRVVWSGRKI